MAVERGAYDQIWNFRRSQLIDLNKQKTEMLRERVLDEYLRRKIFPEFLATVTPILEDIALKDPIISALPDAQKSISSVYATGYRWPHIAGGITLMWGSKIGITDEEIAKLARYRRLEREEKRQHVSKRDLRKLHKEMDKLGNEMLTLDDFDMIGIMLARRDISDPYSVRVLGDPREDYLIPFVEGFEKDLIEGLSYTLKHPRSLIISDEIRVLQPLLSRHP